MRLATLRFRVFVHATEDEARVKDALLWVMGKTDDDRAAGHIDRKAGKGHYGNDIVTFEAVLKKDSDIRAVLEGLLADPSMRADIRNTMARRLDEDNTLHVRLDKQAAVKRQWRLNDGGDAIVLHVKAVSEPGHDPVESWRSFLDGDAEVPASSPQPFK